MAKQDLNSSSTTQQYLDIYDITNDLLLMKNGTASLILSVDAMNFGLLAEEEQDSIIYAYAGLLNSLNYPIQILVRSQTKDVTSYLKKLKDQEDMAGSRENQNRIRRYREFVSNLIHERNVLDKKFFLTIPASPIELGILPVKNIVPGQQQFDISSIERSLVLEKAKNILEPKRDHLIAQFARIGLYAYQLKTQEIIQLFYLSYNPEASEGQQIAESHSYSTPLVKASFQGTPMFSNQSNNGVDATSVQENNMITSFNTSQDSPVIQNQNIQSNNIEETDKLSRVPEFDSSSTSEVDLNQVQTLTNETLPSLDGNEALQNEINATLGQIVTEPLTNDINKKASVVYSGQDDTSLNE